MEAAGKLAALVEKSQRGEPLSADEQAFFEKERKARINAATSATDQRIAELEAGEKPVA